MWLGEDDRQRAEARRLARHAGAMPPQRIVDLVCEMVAEIGPEVAAWPRGPRAFALRLAAASTRRTMTPSLWLRTTPELGRRYVLGEKLGSGGMAEVYAATLLGAEGFARKVAIKRVRASLAGIPAFASMFVAEAQIASRLAHPNIVAVLDFTRDREDRLFLVMEHVDGTDLASLLSAGPVTPALAIYIVVEILRALGYAHALRDPDRGACGVIHRDVSPQNVLLSVHGAVKIADFGLARLHGVADGGRAEAPRGKPSYMSPEQLAGEPLDARSDLYAVGVMLWELLAHRPLFAGTFQEITAQAMFKDIPTPRSAHRAAPRDIEAVAMTLLARAPADRYASAEAALVALLACEDAPRDGRGELAHLLAARTSDAPAAPCLDRSTGGEQARDERRDASTA